MHRLSIYRSYLQATGSLRAAVVAVAAAAVIV